MRNPLAPLEKAIGYRFKKKRLLEIALIHRSYRHESPDTDEDNQRLEFLGDAALGLAAAIDLYAARPDAREGDLTQYRSMVTSTAALAEIASGIGIDAYLKLGKGARKPGAALQPKILADALEAVIGAAYMDRGMRAVERIYARLFAPRLRTDAVSPAEDNPKGALQERCQARCGRSPDYVLVAESGPSHDRVFSVEVKLGSDVMGSGSGASRKAAEVEAARAALRDLR